MTIPLLLSLFTLLGVFYCVLGVIASKKVKTTTDYFLAGRELGLLPVTMTLIATQLGGGMLLGTSEQAYTYGITGILYTLGMASGFLVLGLGLAGRLQELKVATTAEIFHKKYHSPTLKKIASLLSIITLCGILVGQIVASRSVIQGLAISSEWIFILFWLFVIAYTMIGGLKAVVITDLVQVFFIIFVFGGIFLYSALTMPFAWFTRGLAATQAHSFTTASLSVNAFIATLVMPALFSFIEQDLAQRFFAARTKRIAALSALYSAAFLVLFSLIPIYFGMKARLDGTLIPAGSTSPLIPLISSFTSELVQAAAVCAIIAAITSTADSLLCAVSSNVAQDFDYQWLGIKNKLTQSKAITLIIGLGALACSYVVPQNIIAILVGSYELSVSCLLVPLMVAYFKPSVKKNAAIGALCAGFAGFIGIMFWDTQLPKALLPLALSAAGYWIGEKT